MAMMLGWRSAVRPREMVFLLAMLALALQVVVPPGYMVGGGADGPARIVICTAHGAVNAAVDLGGSKAPAHGKTPPMPCAFAGHAAPVSLASPTPSVIVPWVSLTSTDLPTTTRTFVGRGLAAPPPARAPPYTLA
jgi:hypothetical protein